MGLGFRVWGFRNLRVVARSHSMRGPLIYPENTLHNPKAHTPKPFQEGKGQCKGTLSLHLDRRGGAAKSAARVWSHNRITAFLGCLGVNILPIMGLMERFRV